MLQDEWRADGFTAEDVEVWAVGHHATVGQASVFANEHSAPCLGDSAQTDESAFAAYGAGVDDVFIIDRQGQVQFHFTVGVMDLNRSAHQDTVDGWVRELL